MSVLSILIRASVRSAVVLAGIGSVGAATRFVRDADFNLPVFTRPVRGPIYALPLSDGGTLVSGGFVASNGVSQGRLIRLNSRGEVAVANFADGLTMAAGGDSPLVGVQLKDDRVLLALPNTAPNVGGESHVTVSRASLDGTLDDGYGVSFAGSGGEVARVQQFFRCADGRVYVTGNFSVANGRATRDVARLDATGVVDAGFVSRTHFRNVFAATATGEIVGIQALGDGVLVAEAKPLLVHLGPTGDVVESWELPVAVASDPVTIATEADGGILVAIGSPPPVYFSPADPHLSATTEPASALTIYRYRPGQPDGAAIYSAPLTATVSDSGMIWVYAGLSVSAMFPSLDGGVLLLGNVPTHYSGQPAGLLRLKADGSVDPTFVATGLAGGRAAGLQPIAGGWLAILDGSAAAPAPVLRKLTSGFGPRSDFEPDLRETSMPEAAFSLPDGSVLVQGIFAAPDDRIQRFVRVTTDGRTDFEHVPHPASAGLGNVATIDAAGRIYLTAPLQMPVTGVVQTVTTESGTEPALSPSEVERYTLDGGYDAAFGRRELKGATLSAVLVDTEGRILLAGTAHPAGGIPAGRLERLLPTGEPDASFAFEIAPLVTTGILGVASLPAGRGYAIVAAGDNHVLALDEHGSLASTAGASVAYAVYGATGVARAGAATFVLGWLKTTLQVFSPGIARLQANGLPDANWRSGLAKNSAVDRVQVLADGRFLVAGSLAVPGRGSKTFAVLNPDGSLDLNEDLPSAAAVTPAGNDSLIAFHLDGSADLLRAVSRTSVTLSGGGDAQRVGESLRLAAVAPAGTEGAVFSWLHDGELVAGANGPTLEIAALAVADAGVYTVRRELDGGSVYASVRIEVEAATARMLNASARSLVGEGRGVQIIGFVTTGSSAEPVLVRSIRSGLAGLGVVNWAKSAEWPLFVDGTPTVAPFSPYPLYRGTETMATTLLRAGAFGVADLAANPHRLLSPESGRCYSLHASVPAADAGIALSEIYLPEAESGGSAGRRLRNFSCRALCGEGERVLIVGFVVGGNRALPVLVRGLGPALVSRGVAGACADPALAVYRGAAEIAANDDWETQAGADAPSGEIAAVSARIGAAPLATGSRDAALLLAAEPGIYTLMLRPKDASDRVGMVEIFDASE